MNINTNRYIIKNRLLLLFLIVLIPVYSFGQENSTDSRLKIFSEALHEERTISIHLPDNYENLKQSMFPVLYILDAESENQWNRSIKTANDLYKSGIMPDLILLVIHNTAFAGLFGLES
jgi:enterochelin esterase-like enzyme